MGGLIPIFQGWIFGIPGLILLAEYFPPAKRLLDWAKEKADWYDPFIEKDDALLSGIDRDSLKFVTLK